MERYRTWLEKVPTTYYRGWAVGPDHRAGRSGWMGDQYGVTVSARTEDEVKRVIDLHIENLRLAHAKGG